MRSGSLSLTRRNNSGAKLGMPVNVSSSPVVKVSPYRDGAVVVQADDVARPGLLDEPAVGGHEGQRVGDAHLLAGADMEEPLAGLELARSTGA